MENLPISNENLYGSPRGVILMVKRNRQDDMILKVFFIAHSVNTLGNSVNSTVLPSAIGN